MPKNNICCQNFQIDGLYSIWLKMMIFQEREKKTDLLSIGHLNQHYFIAHECMYKCIWKN